MRYLIILNLLFLSILFSGCQDEDQALREQTSKVGKAEREGERLEENATALRMEADLQRRYRFYKSLQGSYAGVLQTAKGQLKVTVDLYLVHPPYPSNPNRIRTIEEVAHDLNGLALNVFINQWESLGGASGEVAISEGGTAEGIFPHIKTNYINFFF